MSSLDNESPNKHSKIESEENAIKPGDSTDKIEQSSEHVKWNIDFTQVDQEPAEGDRIGERKTILLDLDDDSVLNVKHPDDADGTML